jgi:hypothetical protein
MQAPGLSHGVIDLKQMKALRDIAALQPVEWGTARLRVSSENACLPGTGTS